jgi:Ca2+/Na+ antiporter
VRPTALGLDLAALGLVLAAVGRVLGDLLIVVICSLRVVIR